MGNQENQRDVQQEEKALKLFGLLQNAPEDLLERSEKERPGVITFIKKYQTTLVACIALLLIGVGFLGYRGLVGADNAGSSETALDVGSSDAMSKEDAQMEAAEEEQQYVADNDEIAGMFQDVVTGSNGQETEADTDGAAPEAEETSPGGLTAKLNVLDIPEGYVYENITSSLKGGEEILVIRLQHDDGKYMELVVSGTAPLSKEHMTIMDPNGKRIDHTQENLVFPVDESGVTYLSVYYESGLIVEYNGTADAQVVCRVLESLK